MRTRIFRESDVNRDPEGKFARKGFAGANSPTADVPDSPSRHGTGRGMPSIVAGADIRTRKGDEIALDMHHDGTVTFAVNGTSVTHDKATASTLMERIGEASAYEEDFEAWVKSTPTGPDGRPGTPQLAALVRAEGDGAVSVRLAPTPGMSAEALRNTPPINLSGDDQRKLGEGYDRARAATRLDTGPGELDVFLGDGKTFGFRHVGNDGEPVEVEFNARSMARLQRAINVVYEGFDEDDPDGPDDGVTEVDINTNAGKVRVQLDGEWRGDGPGDRLWILPADHDNWGIVVSGNRQEAFGEALEDLELLAEGEGWYDPSNR
ncbi:hypothetical protein ACQEUU_37395 [Nonomuraea sp. CA-218870]|uniref:hypothetical protein n=1 Tax=Nonomuraea sp. CA-218870 TaxID=3239998 RepID=UPI003D92CE72